MFSWRLSNDIISEQTANVLIRLCACVGWSGHLLSIDVRHGLTTHQPLWVILCHLQERGRRDRRDCRNEREGQGKKKNRNESEETEEIIIIKKIPPLYPYLLQGNLALPNCKPMSVGAPQWRKIHDTFTTPNHPGKYSCSHLLSLQLLSAVPLTLVLLTRTYPVFTNSVDPDQLASEEANWYGSTLFAIKYV